jgi:hypothetical protein
MTDESWSVEFPPFSGLFASFVSDIRIVDEIPRIDESGLEKIPKGYIDIINKALQLVKFSSPLPELQKISVDVREYDDNRKKYWNVVHVDESGGGYSIEDDLYDGIFLANNMDNTCGLIPCLATDVSDGYHPVYKCEEPIVYMRAKQLYWITDGTPHMELPFIGDQRQFIRIIMK